MTQARSISDADPDKIKTLHGETMCCFAVEYTFAGKRYSVDVYALDVDQAERRFNAIKSTGEIIGQVVRGKK